jgi:hypothetical protein
LSPENIKKIKNSFQHSSAYQREEEYIPQQPEPASSDDEETDRQASSVKINPKLCHLDREEAIREVYPLHTINKEQVSRSQL